MKKVIEYDYVMPSLVEDCLKEGWQPWGSPFVEGGIAYQAIVKYEELDYYIAPTIKDGL